MADPNSSYDFQQEVKASTVNSRTIELGLAVNNLIGTNPTPTANLILYHLKKLQDNLIQYREELQNPGRVSETSSLPQLTGGLEKDVVFTVLTEVSSLIDQVQGRYGAIKNSLAKSQTRESELAALAIAELSRDVHHLTKNFADYKTALLNEKQILNSQTDPNKTSSEQNSQ